MEWKTSTAAWLHSKGPFVASGLSGELGRWPLWPVQCHRSVRGGAQGRNENWMFPSSGVECCVSVCAGPVSSGVEMK